MVINPQQVQLKNGKEITLRSVKASDAENMLDHLVITHTESYRNMNQTADLWKNLPLEKEKKYSLTFSHRSQNL